MGVLCKTVPHRSHAAGFWSAELIEGMVFYAGLRHAELMQLHARRHDIQLADP